MRRMDSCKQSKIPYAFSFTGGSQRYAVTPEAGTEEKTMNHIQNKALYQALQSIPYVQAKRLYLYYFSGMTLEEIAHMEGVSKVAIHKSIQLGKANLKKILSNAFL